MNIYIRVAQLVLLLTLLIICFITDVKKNKIYNWVVVLFSVIGLALKFILVGTMSGVGSILGGLVPIVLLAPFFIMKMFDPSDIKLFSVIGFLMGVNFSFNNIIYSLSVAAIIFFIIKVIRKKENIQDNEAPGFFQKNFISKRFLSYKKGKGKFPFATAIFLGTILQLVISYQFVSFK